MVPRCLFFCLPAAQAPVQLRGWVSETRTCASPHKKHDLIQRLQQKQPPKHDQMREILTNKTHQKNKKGKPFIATRADKPPNNNNNLFEITPSRFPSEPFRFQEQIVSKRSGWGEKRSNKNDLYKTRRMFDPIRILLPFRENVANGNLFAFLDFFFFEWCVARGLQPPIRNVSLCNEFTVYFRIVDAPWQMVFGT